MPTAPLQPGDPARLGRFEILARLGEGGQGDLVEVLLPADLVVVAREPDAPRVGRDPQREPGQAR